VANALLDFVMSLVRDPDAAARYAADPAGAIADAHLTDVTSADVQNLIPVVAESFSGSPSIPSSVSSDDWSSLDAEPASNIWTSGAATAAFDAFGDFGVQLPVPAAFDTDPAVPTIVDQLDPGLDALTDDDLVDTVTSLQVEAPVVDDVFASGTGLDDWAHPVVQHESPDDEVNDPAPGFDLF
jgi:hypothetical protein